ncbi:hypothetical protein PRIPAC_82176 [Pristionchus pacificus]|uniref:Uncharacterized protein n=1 Tax=Pristionchus pacificus TaxID=54126 RepID=A0A2A6C350_PRIPA|nr:hypothetical protein PRIPAC_82176 [Pristionchus pacificus]|eukprot:PDM72605.1 hypothetical protein PRIPAC_39039 [Pristionchus pacificus]
MCNLFLSLRPKIPRLRLVLLSIRDEQLQRPTAAAAWMDGVLSGMDLQDPLRGTWCGINEQGKIGVLLSITQLQKDKRTDVPSRGRIVHDFLASSLSGADFCDSLASNAHEFNGFTFVALDRPIGNEFQMHSFTNALVDETKTISWNNDVNAVGNCPPHKTYGKLGHGKQLFENILDGIGETATDSEIAESLFAVGTDRKECYPDAQLDSQVTSTSMILERSPQYSFESALLPCTERDAKQR